MTDSNTASVGGVHKTSLAEFMATTQPAETESGATDPVATVETTNGDSNGVQTQEGSGEKSQESESQKGQEVTDQWFVGVDETGEVKLTPTAKFKVKDQEVSAKDIFNAYETRQEISRRFGDLGLREKRAAQREAELAQAAEEQAYIDQQFQEIAARAAEGDALGALQMALAMAGTENDQALAALVKKSVEIADQLGTMSEEEQTLLLQRQALAFKERQIKAQEKKVTSDVQRHKVQAHFNGIAEKYGISEEEWAAAYNDLGQTEQGKAKLNDKDHFNRVNSVASWVLGSRLRGTVREGIRKAAPHLVDDQKFNLALISIIEPNYGIDDVAEVVKAYLGESKVSAKDDSVASKKDVAPKATTPQKAPTKKPEAEKKDEEPVLTWEDMIRKHSS